MKSKLIVVRGGGDLATGVIHRLWSAGLRVLVLEAERPAAIRRQVSLCEAVYEGHATVEGMTGTRIDRVDQAGAVRAAGEVPVLVDPEAACVAELRPAALIDAVMAKRNLGTHRGMAPLTAALGPGFVAGVDVDAVIETARGHDLGRILRSGSAKPNTGIPGMIGGYAAERVLHAPVPGIFHARHQIGDLVEAGETIAVIEEADGTLTPVSTQIGGLLRGLLREDYPVTAHFKIADVDPRREEYKNCFTISDKSRCIAGSALELVIAAL